MALNKKKVQLVKSGQSHAEDENQVNPAKEKLLTEAFLDSLEADKAKKQGYRLEDYRVAGVDSVYYIKDYVSPSTESLLLQCANQLDKHRWQTMKSGRSLKRYGGEVVSKGLINQEELPQYFQEITKQLSKDGLFPDHTPNHVLINSYSPGDGIMPHQDGPAYFPYVCILSLNSTVVINFYQSTDDQRKGRYLARLLAEPRSLLIFTADLYSQFFHGIEPVTEDAIYNPDFLTEETEQLKISNLGLTNYKDVAGVQNPLIVPRDDYRLSLTIRYVPLQEDLS